MNDRYIELLAVSGRNVDGEWVVKPTRFWVSVSEGYFYLRRSTGVSAPTLIEVPLGDLLAALGDAV